MADILMPQLGESVTEGTITRWFKQVGESVDEDEPLFEVSTDKVDTEVPSPSTGVLSEIRVEEGDTVDVGTVLAVLGDGSESQGSSDTAAAESSEAPQDAAPAHAEAAQSDELQPPATAEPRPEPAAAPQAPPPTPQASPSQTPAPSEQPRTPQPAEASSQTDASPSAGSPKAQRDSAQSASPGTGPLLSPLVRRLIEEHDLDPSTIEGSGVGGRITREDVLDRIDSNAVGNGSSGFAPPAEPTNTWASAPGASTPNAPKAAAPAVRAPAAARQAAPEPQRRSPARPTVEPVVPGSGDRVEALNKIRRLTGDAMVASKSAAPHAITIVEVDYERVEWARKSHRETFRNEEGFSLTYLPFISRAVVDALHEFPHMNASMGDGSVVLHDEVHLSVAVDLDFEGLLAPVVRDAHDKRLRAIARDISELARKARSRQLSPDDLSGGTFTLSNSGSFGTSIVVPIINQPQVAILSTDGVSRKPVVITDEFGHESVGIHSMGNLTLAWDHRAFDGAYAAAFCARVKEIIETRDWEAEL